MENVSSNFNTCMSKISVLEEKELNENEIRINNFDNNDLIFRKQDSFKSQTIKEMNIEVEEFKKNFIKEMNFEIEKIREYDLKEINSYESKLKC